MLKQIPLFEDEILPTGEQLRDAGINQAINHANSVTDNWGDKAYTLFLQFIKEKDVFLCEDFRKWCEGKIDTPPSLRSYGATIVRAKKAGQIISRGITQVTNAKAHKANASLWSKAK
jgi:hypothetical protein